MAAALAALCAAPAGAQSLDETTVDGIVGSDIKEERTSAGASENSVLAAIDKATEAAARVRRISDADEIDIVTLGDTARDGGRLPPRIAARVKAHESQIADLRQEVEANALLFHAVDSRRVLVGDILAVDFPDPKTIVVYAVAKPGD